jgi:hypothetical protein
MPIPSGIYIEGSCERKCCELIDLRGPMCIEEMAERTGHHIVSIRSAVSKAVKGGYLKRTGKVVRRGTGHPKPTYRRTKKPLPAVLKELHPLPLAQRFRAFRHPFDVALFGEYARA